MATRLGVTAPAVNKWESGASTPDISLLAPIARLLHITLDELLSFNEKLSELEVKNIVAEIYAMFPTGSVDDIYQKMVDVVREYPNDESLSLELVSLLLMRCLVLGAEEKAKYDEWSESILENLVISSDESIRTKAIESLYAFYISRERYDDAEKCLEYISPDNPDRKRKLATIYLGTGKYDEAYKALEESLYDNYQIMSVLMHQIHTVAIKTEDYKKAEAIIEKESELAELFDMGEFNKNMSKVELSIARKDAEKTLELWDSLLSSFDTMMDYTKSDLFEHMTFNTQMQAASLPMIKANQIKQYCENDTYQFVRESEGWEAFKEKWCK